MDISVDYLIMCERAQEIQDLDTKEDTNIYSDLEFNEIKTFDLQNNQFDIYKQVVKKVWLPNHIQLKTIFLKYNKNNDLLPNTIDLDIKEVITKDLIFSIEKCWLSVIMELVFKKFWSFKESDWKFIDINKEISERSNYLNQRFGGEGWSIKKKMI